MDKKICENCKIEFKPKRSNQKYCSNSCRTKAYRRRSTKSEAKQEDLSAQELSENARQAYEEELQKLTSIEDELSGFEAQAKSTVAEIEREEIQYSEQLEQLKKEESELLKREEELNNDKLLTFGAKFGAAAAGNQGGIVPLLFGVAAGGFLGNQLDKVNRPVKEAKLNEIRTSLENVEAKAKQLNEQSKSRILELSSKLEHLNKSVSDRRSKAEASRKALDILEKEYKKKVVAFIRSKSQKTAEDLKQIEEFSEKLEFQGELKPFIGRPTVPFHIVVYGKPGQGKGWFCVELGKYLSDTFGRVLYASPEESDSPTLSKKLTHFKVGDQFLISGPTSMEMLIDSIDEVKPQFLFVDSLNEANMTDANLKELKRRYPELSTISVAQTDKNGKIRGSQQFKHNTEAVIEVLEGKAIMEKTRFDGHSLKEYHIKFPNKKHCCPGNTDKGQSDLLSC